MAQIPNLDNSPLNLTSIRDQSQKDLINILKNIRGKKCLIIDHKLSGTLGLIIQTSLLKASFFREHGVELKHLSEEPVQTECTKVVYLVRSQIKLMKDIASHVHQDLSKGLQREYFVYFVPRRTVVCEKIFEEEKIHQLLTIGEFPLHIIPSDEDVLSFELDLAYRECHVEGDTSSLWHIAKAIHKLEFSFGVIPNVTAKGKGSTRVAEILNRMQEEEPVNSSDMGAPEISTVILLDREVDMVTPMCTQLTYEGLLDEILGINNGSVELEASIMGGQKDGKKIKVPLNSNDKLFKETRDLNFEVVVQVLRQKATSMKQDYSEMSTTQSVSELKDFVKKLNSLPEMTRHINLAQHMSTFTSKPSFLGRLDIEHTIVEGESYDICLEYIEEMIHKQEPMTNVLRLLVLLSITNSGLPKKTFDYLRRELLHSYGFEHMATLNNLEKAGLFKRQLILHRRPIEDILKMLPGPHLELRRGGYSGNTSYDALPGTQANLHKVADGRRSLILVVFIGGVTFAEVSALRYLSAQEGMPYDLIVATTKMVNGHTLLDVFSDNLDKHILRNT
ncbi:hypothetical protein GIB67_023940 [Kingdonia uniflora]|uniref:Uncharacterized protein n=1 Tax=Kingdonia uniflora TaxID=39325 RepID=A0A7J7M6B3_9MAGN|nr:hypothetical protein GIB67_023940 [Kingdonia uniflora]